MIFYAKTRIASWKDFCARYSALTCDSVAHPDPALGYVQIFKGNSFSLFTFSSASCWNFLLFTWLLPCNFLSDIEQSYTLYSCLHHEMLLSVIFKTSFSLLLISFPLFTFPSASCWIFLPLLHCFPCIFNVVTSQQQLYFQNGVL